MHRLFAALTLPRPVMAALVERMGGIEGARWQGEEQLHITLRFLGERDGGAAEDVAGVIDGFAGPAPMLSFSHYGLFDHRGRVDTLWAGLTPREPIAALKAKLDNGLRRVGIAPDERRFLPHVTLARFGRAGGGPAVPGWIASAPPLPHEPFRAAELVLFESHLGRHGAHYEPVVRRKLD